MCVAMWRYAVLGICLLAGCVGRAGPSRDEVRARCGVEADRWVTASFAEELSADCISALTDGVALDAEATPGTPEWPVVLGALALASTDFGLVGELVVTPFARTWEHDELATFSEEQGLAEDDPAGELLWRYQLAHIARTRLSPGLRQGGHYSLGTVSLPEEPDLHAAPPIWLASVFVHEAGHAHGPAHTACANGGTGCDPDLDGVYGLQAEVLQRERAEIDPWEPDAEEACTEVIAALVTVCGKVDDGGELCGDGLDGGCG